ncbi:hypothetical protein FBQ95_17155 [Chloroflexi bacterium CFX3]|nr:hypothetical protein [Chloroflexi bacterium CFX3]
MQQKVQESYSGSFRGNYPTIEPAANIDTQALLVDDDTPLYVTLPVAQIGRTSANGLFYDEALVLQLVRETPGKWGIFGHIGWQDEGSLFPKPEVYWVGAILEGDLAWAKGYVPPGEARDTVKRLKASGAGIATSIYGVGEAEFIAEGQYRLTKFELQQLDFAPSDRAALRIGIAPNLTKEMDRESTMNNKKDVLAALTASDIPNLPATVVEAILQQHTPKPIAEGRVGELEADVQRLEAEVAGKTRRVNELESIVAKYENEKFEADLRALIAQKVDWQVTTEAARTKLNILRETVYQAVLAKLAGATNLNRAEAIFAEMWESQFRLIAETMRDAMAGPAAIVAPQPQTDWRDAIIERARARTGGK